MSHPKRLNELTHVMQAGQRIDLSMSHVSGTWVAEIDGSHHRLHDFDFLAAPDCLLSVRGSNHPDGTATALHDTHNGLLWFHAKWRQDLQWCNVGGKFATPADWNGTEAWEETRMDLFTADVSPVGHPFVFCRDSKGRLLDVVRIVVECESIAYLKGATDMSAA